MTIRSTALLTLAALFVSTVLTGAAAGASSSLSYSVEENFTATGIDADARGRVEALVKQKGEVSLQRLRVNVAQLDPGTPYVLLAATGDGLAWSQVAAFTTTDSGRATVVQIHNRVLNKVRRVAKKRALAQSLSPLTEVRALAVANTNGDVVLTVDLHGSPSLNFELTSVLENTGHDVEAIGCLAVAVQNGNLQFRLFAASQSTHLTLLINDTPVGTYAADYTGRISIGVFPHAAPSPLLFRKLSVRNTEDEIVLESIAP
jgi:hypothetical protein